GSGQGRSQALDGRRRQWHPTGSNSCFGQPSRLSPLGANPGHHEDLRRATRAHQGTPRSRLRLKDHPRAPTGARLHGGDLPQGQATPASRDQALGRRTDEFLEQCPQKARLVYRAHQACHRLLARLLGGDPRRRRTHSKWL
ncbi:MAG: hypothetical protein AVDCRST_MAG03-2788, partial [uncultured Rubrobacteraceae bacterium]